MQIEHQLVSIATRVEKYLKAASKLRKQHSFTFSTQLTHEGWHDAHNAIVELQPASMGEQLRDEPDLQRSIIEPFAKALALHQQVLAYVEARSVNTYEHRTLEALRTLVAILEGKVQPAQAPTPGPAITLTYGGVTIPVTVSVEGKRFAFGDYQKAKA